MKIQISKEKLLKALTIADSIISSKNINALLFNCLFNVKKNEIEIISNNTETITYTTLEASSDQENSFTVNGKKMATILREFPDDQVVIEVNESMILDLKSQSEKLKGNYKLIGTLADDYPEIEKFVEDNLIKLEQSFLKKIINKVIYAASLDSIKPAYNGVCLKIDPQGNLTAVSTDSKRMAFYTTTIENPLKEKHEIIIPLKTISQIAALLNKGEVFLSFDKKRFFVQIDETKIISRIVDESFPNYKSILESKILFKTKIEKEDLLSALKRVMIFTKEPTYRVTLIFKGENLTIKAKTPEIGEAQEELQIQSLHKEELSLQLNAYYLTEALKRIETSALECSLTGINTPLLITPFKDSQPQKDELVVIMPFKFEELD